MGAERVAIASEPRNAPNCTLCKQRKDALSLYTIEGEYDSLGVLPEVSVKQIHRIVTDPSRLTRKWYDGLIEAGLTPEKYVEALGCMSTTIDVDTFCQGIGIDIWPLPEAHPREPTLSRPLAEVGMAMYSH